MLVIFCFFRLLLWDCDDRRYSFYVEVSTNSREWTTICDRSRQPCQSWQSISFSPQPVVYVRIVGTQNTANDVITLLHSHLFKSFTCFASSFALIRFFTAFILNVLLKRMDLKNCLLRVQLLVYL